MSARKKIHGVCFNIDKPASERLVEDALRFVAPHVEWIRTYEVQKYIRYARAVGLKCAVGAWIGPDMQTNAKQVLNLIDASKRGEVDLAIIGNEALFRGDRSGTELAHIIAHFKEAGTGVPATTGEVAKFLIQNPEVIEACDIVGMHHYPYWEGVPVENAIEDFDTVYRAVKALAGEKEIQVLETGWPSAGNAKGKAVPSRSNARRYYRELMMWARTNGVKIFWFEAFDEAWKAEFEGPQGAHWGMWHEPGARRKYR